MIQPIKIIAIFVYRLNEGNPHIPGSLSATLGYHFKSLSIMDNKKLPTIAEGPNIMVQLLQGPNVKFTRTVLPVDRDLSDTDSIVYELLINKAWDQYDFAIQMAEELGYEFMDEEEYDGIMYDYYFKFI